MSEVLSYIEVSARLHFYENHSIKLTEQLEKADEKIKELTNELNRVTELLKLAGKKMYGSSTEKICDDYDQFSFFDDEYECEITEPAVPDTVKTYQRTPKRSFEEIYSSAPSDVIVYDVPEDERLCEKCNTEMVSMGYDSYREIEYTPSVLKIIEHRREKYVCRKCDKDGLAGNIKTAKSPEPLFDHSFVSPSLLAYILNEKFCKAVPLYRQEQEFKRMGISISRQTMSNWIIAAADLLKPLYDILHKKLLSENILHADETPLQVNHVKGTEKPVKGYLWVYRTGKYSDNPIVLYEYCNGRNGKYPVSFLNGFSGYLHCDGLRQYDDVKSAVRSSCFAHLRRYFLNAVNVQHNKKDHTTIAGQGFLKIQEIFHIEGRNPEKPHEKSKYTLDEIFHIRKEKSALLVADFFKWCEEKQGIAAPKSLTGKAITYALNQRRSFHTFLQNPKLELTNNAAERSVKPVVIGHKNWLFANTEKGAQAVAVLYSIIETAKQNSLKPYDYLVWVLSSIRSMKFSDFSNFIPFSHSIPLSLRMGG